MKMHYTYGIFDDEADHIIDLVRQGDVLVASRLVYDNQGMHTAQDSGSGGRQ